MHLLGPLCRLCLILTATFRVCNFLLTFNWWWNQNSKSLSAFSIVSQLGKVDKPRLKSDSPEKPEKAMAAHSSPLAWRIPWTEEPGQSMGSWRVGHHWVTSLSLFTFMHWRQNWQPTPVFLPGESQGWRSLVGYHLWGRTELDTTERLSSSSSYSRDLSWLCKEFQGWGGPSESSQIMARGCAIELLLQSIIRCGLP